MKVRHLSIAMVVLAALLGVLYWSNRRQAKEEANPKPSPDAPPKILSLNSADINELKLHRKGEPEISITRDAAGLWQITAPKALAADQEAVSSMLSTLSALGSERLLEEKASEVGGYGLANPQLEVAVTGKDHKTEKLLIGDQTPAGNSFYTMLAGDPRLFTMASYNKTSLDKTLNDLRDKRLITADFDKVSQIELRNQKPDKKVDITFAREKDAWQILKPKPYRADSYQVEELIRALKDARFDASADGDDAKSATAFKSGSPVAAAKLTGASGTQELELRKAKDDYYAKSSLVSGFYKVPASLGTSLDKTLNDFRNKKVFDFGYAQPTKIEIHEGTKSFFLTRSGSDWWGPDGKKLDEGSAQALVSQLRDLSANQFPDSEFTAPTIEITVASNEGKRVEKVSLAKNGDAYLAKRDGEPVLYDLSAAAVTDLEKAAADLKPASDPKNEPKK